MENANRVVTIPKRTDLLKCLLKINNSTYFQNGLYHSILEKAGEEHSPQEIAEILEKLIKAHADNLPGVFSSLMYNKVPQFVEAITSDPEVMSEIKKILHETLGE